MASIKYEKYFPKNFSKLPNDYTFQYVKNGKLYSKPIKKADEIIALKKGEKEPETPPYYIATNYGKFTEILVGAIHGHAGFKTYDNFPSDVKKHLICQAWGDKVYDKVEEEYGYSNAVEAFQQFIEKCTSRFNITNPIK